MPKSCANHIKIIHKSCPDHPRSSPNHLQVMPKSLPDHLKFIPTSFQGHPKIIAKSSKIITKWYQHHDQIISKSCQNRINSDPRPLKWRSYKQKYDFGIDFESTLVPFEVHFATNIAQTTPKLFNNTYQKSTSKKQRQIMPIWSTNGAQKHRNIVGAI